MPSYVNYVYVDQKLRHIDEQISSIRHRKLATPLGGATKTTATISFQKERRDILKWATTASDDEVAKALSFLDGERRPAVEAMKTSGDLSGVSFDAVQAQAYWELITCVTTPPETGVTL